MAGPGENLVLTSTDVRATLDIASCIEAVEVAFRRHHAGDVIAPAVLGSHVPGGGFHVKTAGMRGDRSYYAVKVNANFPGNPAGRGLPTIQGVLALFDAESGEVLALMDSTEITALRTAAASAVAARHLAPRAAHGPRMATSRNCTVWLKQMNDRLERLSTAFQIMPPIRGGSSRADTRSRARPPFHSRCSARWVKPSKRKQG